MELQTGINRAGSTAIVNIGAILTGDLDAPRSDAEAILIVEGRIAAVGRRSDMPKTETVIDARGCTVAPGLIDSHCHVVLGDYTPRQNTVGFLSSYVHGGITQVISAGEIHLPGRPHDRVGVKALAIIAQRSWANYRPNGMKVNGGAVILEPELTTADFVDLAAEGVALAKFGFGLYDDPRDGLPQVQAAQAAHIRVMCHSGGASIPGCRPITTEDLLHLKPDVCGHINGGPTSLDDAGVERIVRETDLVLQIVQAGCLRSALHIVRLVMQMKKERRVILGSDTPTGTGVMPLGMLKTIAELSSLGGVDPAVAWSWGSGTTAQLYGLDAGIIEPGRAADLCVLDAPWGSQATDAETALRRGDIPGIAGVLIDGEVRVLRSRNTPAPTRTIDVTPAVGELAGASYV